eukprot:1507107-Amphidinium_carterae.1
MDESLEALQGLALFLRHLPTCLRRGCLGFTLEVRRPIDVQDGSMPLAVGHGAEGLRGISDGAPVVALVSQVCTVCIHVNCIAIAQTGAWRKRHLTTGGERLS